MSEITDSLLRLRAKMVVRNTDKELHLPDDKDKHAVYSLRAYYLGQEYPEAKQNPFEKLDHPYKRDLVEGFRLSHPPLYHGHGNSCANFLGSNSSVGTPNRFFTNQKE